MQLKRPMVNVTDVTKGYNYNNGINDVTKM